MPSKRTLWCRVGRDAADKGLSLIDLGAALIDSVKRLEEVGSAEVVFVTSSAEDVRRLTSPAASAQRLVDAMMKNFDCETCEYQDVCDTVMDLKKIRSKLTDSQD